MTAHNDCPQSARCSHRSRCSLDPKATPSLPPVPASSLPPVRAPAPCPRPSPQIWQDSIDDYGKRERKDWLFDHVAQLCIVVTQYAWTKDTEAAFDDMGTGNMGAMKEFAVKQVSMLGEADPAGVSNESPLASRTNPRWGGPRTNPRWGGPLTR
eukprot:628727-Prymnesium_polylepis.2